MANALAYQIQHRISPNRRIFVVRPSDAPVVSLADVTYRLYPRRIYWVQQLPIRVKDAPPADEPCTIDWPSAEDVFTLTCPDFSWSYPDSGAAHP